MNEKQSAFRVPTVHIAGSRSLIPRPSGGGGGGEGMRPLEAIVTEVGTVQALIQ